MIVADTSALISLATADALSLVLDEFDVQTTATVLTELEATAEYDDVHGTTATAVLASRDQFTVHECDDQEFNSSRIDVGEGSCLALARREAASFLLTDDLRALPELQVLTEAQVALSPIVLRALVKRGVLTNEEALDRLNHLAHERDWLGAPIYRRARTLFE